MKRETLQLIVYVGVYFLLILFLQQIKNNCKLVSTYLSTGFFFIGTMGLLPLFLFYFQTNNIFVYKFALGFTEK